MNGTASLNSNMAAILGLDEGLFSGAKPPAASRHWLSLALRKNLLLGAAGVGAVALAIWLPISRPAEAPVPPIAAVRPGRVPDAAPATAARSIDAAPGVGYGPRVPSQAPEEPLSRSKRAEEERTAPQPSAGEAGAPAGAAESQSVTPAPSISPELPSRAGVGSMPKAAAPAPDEPRRGTTQADAGPADQRISGLEAATPPVVKAASSPIGLAAAKAPRGKAEPVIEPSDDHPRTEGAGELRARRDALAAIRELRRR